MIRACRLFPIVIACLFLGFDALAGETDVGTDSGLYDVMLVVDTSKATANISKESARVAIYKMGDTHRLGIVTFGAEAKIVHPLERISTLEERTMAVGAFNSANLDGTGSSLAQGLTVALDHLTDKGRKNAKKIVVLLTDGRVSDFPKRDHHINKIKTEVLPAFLKKRVVLHVVALGEANLGLLQICANITGGKLLAAPNVPTMTDALDTLMERLKPPQKIVVPKVTPGMVVERSAPDSGSESGKTGSALRGMSGMVLAFGAIAILILALLAVGIAVLVQVLKNVRPKKLDERAEPSDRVAKEGGFAELRDVSNSLHNLLVDAGELAEHLNLDLEDFGVEGWKKQNALRQKYGGLARGVFLLIDHLEIGVETGSDQELQWLRDKLERILEDEQIEEMKVKPGEAFDGRFHVHIGEAASDLPPGSVLEIKRKGYEQRVSRGDSPPTVLRRAEVVVVRGKAKDGQARKQQVKS